MKAAGWRGTALDPDPRAAAHARNVVGVNAVCGDFMTLADLGRFDAVTFNKVLEHVEDPVLMLARSRQHLADGGFVYIELPDGEAAAEDGPGREEFFIARGLPCGRPRAPARAEHQVHAARVPRARDACSRGSRWPPLTKR